MLGNSGSVPVVRTLFPVFMSTVTLIVYNFDRRQSEMECECLSLDILDWSCPLSAPCLALDHRARQGANSRNVCLPDHSPDIVVVAQALLPLKAAWGRNINATDTASTYSNSNVGRIIAAFIAKVCVASMHGLLRMCKN